MEYIQFSLSGLDVGGADILKKIREVMEKAIQHGGLHPVKGAILWDSYRDFEMALYQTSKQGSSEEIATQTRRITQLFNRQLSVPLLDMVTYICSTCVHKIIKTFAIGTYVE